MLVTAVFFTLWASLDGDDSARARREVVNEAIELGVTYLERQEDMLGQQPELSAYPGGDTCLVFYTLLMCGQDRRSPIIARLHQTVTAAARDVDHTYTLSLALLGLLVHDRERNATLIGELIARIEGGQLDSGPGKGAWSYLLPGGREGLKGSVTTHPGAHWNAPDGWWDNSNTQFAILALRAADDYGFAVSRPVLEAALQHCLEQQNGDGGCGYSATSRPSSYIAMTAGVLGSAIMCADALDAGETSRRLRGRVERAVKRGTNWLSRRLTYPLGDSPWPYYAAYAVERLGHYAAIDQFGDHDWYAEGADWLIDAQAEEGSWSAISAEHTGNARNSPLMKKSRLRRAGASGSVVDTCFALLFLRRSSYMHTLASEQILSLLKGIDEQDQDETLERIRARVLAAGDAAVPQLVRALFLPTRAAQTLAAECLRTITGESFGYLTAETPDEERAARLRWVDFLRRRSAESAGG